jgi:hypothetical protein
MVDPPASAIERLVEALDKIRSQEISPRLPAWRGFVRAWLEARRASRSREELRQEISDIVEDILPERSLRSGEISFLLSSPFHSTEWDVASGILYEVGPPDGARRLARAEIVGLHGLWEKLTPLRYATREEEAASLAVRYALRWPSARKLVRDALTQELEGQVAYGAGQSRKKESAINSSSPVAINAEVSAPEKANGAAAELGAPIAATIPEPGADVTFEIGPGEDMPAAVRPQPARAKRFSQKPRSWPVNGERLRELRGDEKQESFAEKCSVSVPTLQRGEKGAKWSRKTIDRVAQRLEIDSSIFVR